MTWKKSKSHDKRRMGKSGKTENWKKRQGWIKACMQIGSFNPYNNNGLNYKKINPIIYSNI